MKKIIAIMLAIAVVLSFFACSGKKTAELKVDVNGIGRNLLEQASFEFKPEEMPNPAYFATEQLKLDVEKVAKTDAGEIELYVAVSPASPEAVVVIGAKDAETAKSISETELKAFLQYNIDGYTSYGPDQVPKLNSAINKVDGRYVFYVVSSDNTAATKTLNDLISTARELNNGK